MRMLRIRCRAFPDPQRLGRFRLAVDTANGATATVAPRLFRDLGYEIELTGAQPDGRNINLACGSTHPQAMSATVREKGLPDGSGIRR